MPVPFDFSSLVEDPEAQYDAQRMKGLADALRGQQAAALLAASSGDRRLMPLAQMVTQGGQQQAVLGQEGIQAGARARGERLKRAMDAIQAREAAQHRQHMERMEEQRLGQEAWDEIKTDQGIFRMNKRTGELVPLMAGGISLKPPPKPNEQPKVPAGEAADLGSVDAATRLLERLSVEWDEKVGNQSLLSAAVTQLSPASKVAQYKNARAGAAQKIGLALEKGKLGEADLPRYRNMMPDPLDTKEVKDAKVEHLRQLLADEKESRIRAMGAAGYDIGALGGGQAAPGQPPPPAPAPMAPGAPLNVQAIEARTRALLKAGVSEEKIRETLEKEGLLPKRASK